MTTETPQFATYWIIGGQKITDFSEVEKLVEEGKLAAEIPAEMQLAQWKRQQQIEKLQAERAEELREAAEERAYRESPEGRRAAAIRFAQENPGGVVTVAGGGNTFFDELDQYGPAKTDIFSQ